MDLQIDQWEIEVRPWGWLRLRETSGEGPIVYLQFQINGSDGHERVELQTVAMRSRGDEPLSGRAWRRIPISRLENSLAFILTVAPAEAVDEDAKRELSKNRAAFVDGVPGIEPPSLDMLDDFFEASDGVMVVGIAPWDSGMLVSPAGRMPEIKPPEGRLTDDFLQDVADAYRLLTDASKAPAPSIAESAGVPVRTVHRWIYEARKRGILPPARAGRAG